MKLAVLLAGAYLAGSVNFSILLFKILGREDPRRQCSGNAGVTNVYRQAGLLWAAVVLILDVGRALGVCWAALHMLPVSTVPWIGFSFIIGNRYPCFHQFRGGKGVAGYLGFTALISPISAGISALVWVLVYGIVRIPFIASFFMIAVLALGTIIACGFRTEAVEGTVATVLFISANHRQNVAAFFHKLTAHLAETKFVRTALTEEIDIGAFRVKPTPRMIAGLILVGLSYVLGWPAVAASGFLAFYQGEPLIAVIGGPAIYAISHLLFFAGAWLAGAEHVRILTRYGTKLLFKKLLNRKSTFESPDH